MAGEIRGRDALVAWLGQLRAKGFWLTEHDVLGNDIHVRALSIMGARRPGVDVPTRVVSVFHYRDGQQIERWIPARGPRRMGADLRRPTWGSNAPSLCQPLLVAYRLPPRNPTSAV